MKKNLKNLWKNSITKAIKKSNHIYMAHITVSRFFYAITWLDYSHLQVCVCLSINLDKDMQSGVFDAPDRLFHSV
jgi:3-methyladenine DNA glycosylase Tag